MDCSLPGSSSMGFPREEYWSQLSFLSPGDLHDPGIKHGSPILQVYSLLSAPPGKPHNVTYIFLKITVLWDIVQKKKGDKVYGGNEIKGTTLNTKTQYSCQ